MYSDAPTNSPSTAISALTMAIQAGIAVGFMGI
jgi:hypothetical protein